MSPELQAGVLRSDLEGLEGLLAKSRLVPISHDVVFKILTHAVITLICCVLHHPLLLEFPPFQELLLLGFHWFLPKEIRLNRRDFCYSFIRLFRYFCILCRACSMQRTGLKRLLLIYCSLDRVNHRQDPCYSLLPRVKGIFKGRAHILPHLLMKRNLLEALQKCLWKKLSLSIHVSYVYMHGPRMAKIA